VRQVPRPAAEGCELGVQLSADAEVTIKVFNLPDIGEGLVEARVDDIKVAVGDKVERFDVIADVETDKAVVELNAPWTGTVHKIHAEVDEYIEVGKPVIEIAVPVAA
jgi:2-oxoisovalerate dehydrogenase E2 component (dihydrolipoyl transacylase)